MDHLFIQDDIEKISEILQVKAVQYENSWTWTLKNNSNNNVLILSIYNNIHYTNSLIGNLISVQTQYGYFEIHSCSHYITFEPDELIFIQDNDNTISCLIIGKEANCSMFSNIRKKLLSSDYTNLDAPLLLSAMQLSIVENIIS